MHRGSTRTLSGSAIALTLAFVCPVLAAESSLGAWRDYAARGLTPDFSWADRPAVEDVRPTVIDTAFAPNAFAARLAVSGDLALGLSISRGAADRALDADGRFEPLRLTRGNVLERTFVAPSLTRALDERTSISAGVVLADQRFATPGLGSTTVTEFTPSIQPTNLTERSYGSGVRLSLEERLGDKVSFSTAYQSKIDMDALQTYRGVYGAPGDFDVPALVSATLAWSPAATHTFDFDVQRVLYSEIPAFASASLPSRLLQALGDSGTPKFTWRDLTVYGVNWTWRATSRDALRLRYSTQLQPEPADETLRATLADGFTDDNVSMAYLHDFGVAGTLEIGASYASSPYFMGNWSRPSRDQYGDQIEVEAIWSVDF